MSDVSVVAAGNSLLKMIAPGTPTPLAEKESREDRDESPRPGTRDGEGGQEERAQEGG